jgi:hypothetical protein
LLNKTSGNPGTHGNSKKVTDENEKDPDDTGPISSKYVHQKCIAPQTHNFGRLLSNRVFGKKPKTLELLSGGIVSACENVGREIESGQGTWW